jgi:hypothetical protein
MANRFNTFMDAWTLHRVWGLPLRMIFLCSWHRVHFAFIAVGGGLIGVGALIHKPLVAFVGASIAAPSMLCLALLPVLAVLCVGLEKLFADRPGR